jgi:hypothetical protein
LQQKTIHGLKPKTYELIGTKMMFKPKKKEGGDLDCQTEKVEG